MKNIFFIIFLFFIGQNLVGQGKNKSKIPSVLDQTNKFDGFFDFNYDEKKDIIYLTVNQLNKEFLYINNISFCLQILIGFCRCCWIHFSHHF